MTVSACEWQVPFGKWPVWMCPTCQKSTLYLLLDTLKRVETGASRQAHDHEAWDPEWLTCRFVVLLKCANGECGEVIACQGEGSVETDPATGDYEEVYTPKHFYPPLKFFRVAPECPDAVEHHLIRAFATAWSDTASTVNAMRSTLEAILTDRNIPRTKVDLKRGKRVPLNLQVRVDKYVLNDPDATDYLKALRWLGNNGSHAHGKVPKMADLLEGFAVLEHVIEHIYVRRSKAVTKLAKDIVRRKGKPWTKLGRVKR